MYKERASYVYVHHTDTHEVAHAPLRNLSLFHGPVRERKCGSILPAARPCRFPLRGTPQGRSHTYGWLDNPTR